MIVIWERFHMGRDIEDRFYSLPDLSAESVDAMLHASRQVDNFGPAVKAVTEGLTSPEREGSWGWLRWKILDVEEVRLGVASVTTLHP